MLQGVRHNMQKHIRVAFKEKQFCSKPNASTAEFGYDSRHGPAEEDHCKTRPNL